MTRYFAIPPGPWEVQEYSRGAYLHLLWEAELFPNRYEGWIFVQIDPLPPGRAGLVN